MICTTMLRRCGSEGAVLPDIIYDDDGRGVPLHVVANLPKDSPAPLWSSSTRSGFNTFFLFLHLIARMDREIPTFSFFAFWISVLLRFAEDRWIDLVFRVRFRRRGGANNTKKLGSEQHSTSQGVSGDGEEDYRENWRGSSVGERTVLVI